VSTIKLIGGDRTDVLITSISIFLHLLIKQDELKRNINFMQLDPIKKKVHI